MAKFNSITEQLKGRECKVVLGVLTAAKSRVLKRWKLLDNSITDANNEAKDNVKYLSTLEKYIEPLSSGNPVTILDALPGLLNNIKMMLTIARCADARNFGAQFGGNSSAQNSSARNSAQFPLTPPASRSHRYYNTTERMTTLFRKITNKMIANCRNYVMEGADRSAALWEQPMMGVVARLQACLALNEGYQEQYFMTRDKLLTQPKGKQFDFNESAIFGKFDLFVRRVEKLIEMFSTVEQFSVLATHNVEGMEGLMNSFRQIVDEFKRKPYELLDYQKGQVAPPPPPPHRQPPPTTLPPSSPSPPSSSSPCTVRPRLPRVQRQHPRARVESPGLHQRVVREHHVDRAGPRHAQAVPGAQPPQLGATRRTSAHSAHCSLTPHTPSPLQAILQRESLKDDLDSKFMVIFHNYGLDLETVQRLYEKQKHAPPHVRNAPPVTGTSCGRAS